MKDLYKQLNTTENKIYNEIENILKSNTDNLPTDITYLSKLIKFLQITQNSEDNQIKLETDNKIHKNISIWLGILLKNPFNFKQLTNIKYLEEYLKQKKEFDNFALLLSNYSLNNNKNNIYRRIGNKYFLLDDEVDINIFYKILSKYSNYELIDEVYYYNNSNIKEDYEIKKYKIIITMNYLKSVNLIDNDIKNKNNNNTSIKYFFELLNIQNLTLAEISYEFFVDYIINNVNIMKLLVENIQKYDIGKEYEVINTFNIFIRLLYAKHKNLLYIFTDFEHYLFFDVKKNELSEKIREISLFYYKTYILYDYNKISNENKNRLLNILFNIFIFDRSMNMKYNVIEIYDELKIYLNMEELSIFNKLFDKTNVKNFLISYVINVIKNFEYFNTILFKRILISKLLDDEYNIQEFALNIYKNILLIHEKYMNYTIDLKKFDNKLLYLINDIFRLDFINKENIFLNNIIESKKLITSVIIFYINYIENEENNNFNLNLIKDCLILDNKIKYLPNINNFIVLFYNSKIFNTSKNDKKIDHVNFLITNNLLTENNVLYLNLKDFVINNSEYYYNLLYETKKSRIFNKNSISNNNLSFIKINENNISKLLINSYNTKYLFNIINKIIDKYNTEKDINSFIYNSNLLILKIIKIYISYNNIIHSNSYINLKKFILDITSDSLDNYNIDYRGDYSWTIRKESIIIRYILGYEHFLPEFIYLLFGRSKYLREYMLSLLVYNDIINNWSVLDNKIKEYEIIKLKKNSELFIKDSFFVNFAKFFNSNVDICDISELIYKSGFNNYLYLNETKRKLFYKSIVFTFYKADESLYNIILDNYKIFYKFITDEVVLKSFCSEYEIKCIFYFMVRIYMSNRNDKKIIKILCDNCDSMVKDEKLKNIIYDLRDNE